MEMSEYSQVVAATSLHLVKYIIGGEREAGVVYTNKNSFLKNDMIAKS